MNVINKTMISALLAASALGLTASMPAFATQADVANYCSGCHGITLNGVMVAGDPTGGGTKTCNQRTVAAWTTTIGRMNSKGCGVPTASIASMANYLASVGVATTTTTTTTTVPPTTVPPTTVPPTTVPPTTVPPTTAPPTTAPPTTAPPTTAPPTTVITTTTTTMACISGGKRGGDSCATTTTVQGTTTTTACISGGKRGGGCGK